jgi:hypothetical protein
MKRKRPNPTLSAEDEQLIAAVGESLGRAFALKDAADLAQILYERSMKSGEAISPKLLQTVQEWSGGGAPSKLLEAVPLIRKARKRAEVEDKTIKAGNQKRQREAEANHQLYRDIAEKLIANNRRLRKATPNRVAQLVEKELQAMSKKPPTTRTILRALLPKK